jgi:ubiquinone/menaquinone biosynthesis C-methylase UbiE
MNHYTGLVADWYDDFLIDDYLDVVLYTSLVREHGGPALELACGTGRLLLALHNDSVEADGVDISAEMLGRCRSKAAAAGFSPRLECAPMQEFSMGRLYRSVLVAGGSFQLLTEAEDIESCLHGIREHLHPGGRVFLDVDVSQPASHSDWKIGRTAVRGDETLVYMSTNTYDGVTRRNTIQTRYELLRGNRIVKKVNDTIVMRVFDREEMEMLLTKAGFTIIDVRSVRLFDAHPSSVLFIAER